MTEPSGKSVVKTDPVFAEAINPRPSKNETGPAARIFDFFIPTPDCPGEQSAIRPDFRAADDLNWKSDLHPVSKLLFLPP